MGLHNICITHFHQNLSHSIDKGASPSTITNTFAFDQRTLLFFATVYGVLEIKKEKNNIYIFFYISSTPYTVAKKLLFCSSKAKVFVILGGETPSSIE